MEEKEKYEFLREPLGKMVFQPTEIIYETVDGRRFKDKEEARQHSKVAGRKRHYEFLLERRNWLQKLFNIKPSMSYYDEIALIAEENERLEEEFKKELQQTRQQLKELGL